MDVNLIITDDFLANPDHVREQVLKIPFDRTGGFPGARTEVLTKNTKDMFNKKYQQ